MAETGMVDGKSEPYNVTVTVRINLILLLTHLELVLLEWLTRAKYALIEHNIINNDTML